MTLREPVPESEMEDVKYYSIYQVLRDVYHLTSDPTIKHNCRVAVAMAKAMHNKVVEYGLRPMFGFPEYPTGYNTAELKPYLKKNMLRAALHGRGGQICEVIHQSYLLADDQVQFLLRTAMRMTKLIHMQLANKAEYGKHAEYTTIVDNTIVANLAARKQAAAYDPDIEKFV